jgi:hypothetical protein
MNARQSRAELLASLVLLRANAIAKRPPSEWPRHLAMARYVALAREAAAGRAGPGWRAEVNGLLPVVLGPIPQARRAVRMPRRSA